LAENPPPLFRTPRSEGSTGIGILARGRIIWTETAAEARLVDRSKSSDLYHRLWFIDENATKGGFVPSNLLLRQRNVASEEADRAWSGLIVGIPDS
jgi:hypothetical protein